MNFLSHTMKRPAAFWTSAVLLTFAASWMLGRAVLFKEKVSAEPDGGRATAPASEHMKAALHSVKAETDPLSARLRLLELIAEAEASELSVLFLSSQTDNRAKLAIAQRWAEKDPADFYRFLRGVNRSVWEKEAVYGSACGILFRTWVKTDSAAALAAAKEAGVKPAFRAALRECVQALFESDPEKAFEAADGLSFQSEAGDRLITAELEKNPAAFLAAAEKGSLRALSSGTVSAAVKTVFGAWTKQNPAAAAAWLAGTPSTLRRALWTPLAAGLAEADTDFTRGWIEGLPPSGDREEAGALLVARWGEKDPQAALAWLQDHLQGGRRQAFEALARAMVERSVGSARSLLDSMPPGQARDGVLSAIANRWAGQDVKAAADWVLSFPEDDPARSDALRSLGPQWVRADPEAAAAYVREHPGDGALRHQTGEIAKALAKKGLTPALEWALDLPKTSRKDAAGALLHDSSGRSRIEEIARAAENLDVVRQERLAGELADRAVFTASDDPANEERVIRGVSGLPPGRLQDAFVKELATLKVEPGRLAKIRSCLEDTAKLR